MRRRIGVGALVGFALALVAIAAGVSIARDAQSALASTNAPVPCAAPGFPGGDLYQVPNWDKHVCLDAAGVAAASQEPGVLIFAVDTTVSVFVSAEGDLYEMNPVFWPRLLGETRYFEVTLGKVVEVKFPPGQWGLGPGQKGSCLPAGLARIRKWSPGVCLGLHEADGGLVYAALEAAEMEEPGGTVYVRPGETVWGTIWISPHYMNAHGYPDRGAMFWPRTEGVAPSCVIPIGVLTEVTLSGGEDGSWYGLGHAPDPAREETAVDPCLAKGLRQVPGWSVPICGNDQLIAGTSAGRPGVVTGPISGGVLLILSEGDRHGYTEGATLYGPGDPIEIPLDNKVSFNLGAGEWGLGR